MKQTIERFNNQTDKSKTALIAACDLMTRITGQTLFFTIKKTDVDRFDIEIHFKDKFLVQYFYMFYGAARQKLNNDFDFYFNQREKKIDESHN